MAVSRIPSIELLQSLRCSVTPQIRSSTCQARLRVQNSLARSSIQTSSYSTSKSQHLAATKPSPPTSNPQPSSQRINPLAPTTKDRGPTSEEDTQTDFSVMDIFSQTPEPATSIDACTPTGFHLNNGLKVTNAAVLLAGGQAYAWKPWLALSPPTAPTPVISDMLDPRRGTLVFPEASLNILAHLHPKPDLLLLGTGARTWALEPITRKYIMETLGIRLEITDTANATAAYNLLAKERGVEGGSGVGGAFLPLGWKGPEGAGRRR